MSLCLASLPAAAAEPIRVAVMVSKISDAPGGIDERAAKLHAELGSQFKYQSLRVLDEHDLRVAIDDVAKVDLPDGRTLQLSPLHVDARGVLLAVDLSGTLKTDMRVKSGHLVVIGANRFEDGKLVVSLEPRFLLP